MSRPYPCIYCTEDGHCKKFSDEEVVSWCVLGPCKDEKPSNGDLIRAMTDEEMAEHLYLLRIDALRLEGYEGFIETKDEILDWLKSVHRLAEEVDDATD